MWCDAIKDKVDSFPMIFLCFTQFQSFRLTDGYISYPFIVIIISKKQFLLIRQKYHISEKLYITFDIKAAVIWWSYVYIARNASWEHEELWVRDHDKNTIYKEITLVAFVSSTWFGMRTRAEFCQEERDKAITQIYGPDCRSNFAFGCSTHCRENGEKINAARVERWEICGLAQTEFWGFCGSLGRGGKTTSPAC